MKNMELSKKNMENAIKVYIRNLLEQLALVNPGSPFYKPIPGDPINLVIALGYSDAVVQAYVKNNSNLALDVHHFTSHCLMARIAKHSRT